MMKPKMESCWNCEAIYGCYYNDFDRCPKIEIAADGLGIPVSQKKEAKQEFSNVPFGVYRSLKHMVEIYEKLPIIKRGEVK